MLCTAIPTEVSYAGAAGDPMRGGWELYNQPSNWKRNFIHMLLALGSVTYKTLSFSDAESPDNSPSGVLNNVKSRKNPLTSVKSTSYNKTAHIDAKHNKNQAKT